ncbi:HlyD family type I secretion periplasmic adaptor subunit [Desulfosarcina sp. OttesenSCG-928-A07]|nr:HlyD family type I secretion periplasmic adaptor subunit [Desulfosarcina sp. OttesenSCG-928-G17]MDL2330362.1 HlyD family type I secretion periplasmic adaptor subunit [Desulfosarcina sp. OttesenSCG-928-A07]
MTVQKNDESSRENPPKKAPTTPEVIDVTVSQASSPQRQVDALEVENPRKIIRQGIIIVILFFGVMGTWSIMAHITGAVVAPGTIKVETERKTVQHLEGGIVDTILVREGDHVRAGDTLVTLKSIQVDASVDMLYKQLVGSLAAQERLQAEKDLLGTLAFSGTLKALADEHKGQDLLNNESKTFAARREAMMGQISMLKSQIAQVGAQISGVDQQIRAEEAIIAALTEEFSPKRELYEKGYLEKTHILELQRQLADHRGRQGQLVQSRAEAMQKQIELRLRIDDTTNRFVEEAASQLAKLDNEIAQIREKIRPMSDAKDRLQVMAPVTGKVVGLKVHSHGGVIRPGDPILDIVPDDTPMVILAQVPVNRIADVHIGQDALVQMDAFDTRITPNIEGRVTYLSADRLEYQTPQGTTPYYECYVEVLPAGLEKYGMYMSPGMPATVYITTKKRSVLYYMLEPLIKNWNRALRD